MTPTNPPPKKAPKQFWLRFRRPFTSSLVEGTCGIPLEDGIHVIEMSAYTKLKSERDAAVEQLAEARSMVLDLFNQSCQVKWDHEKDWAVFDHGCISAYEEAQDDLLRWEMIKDEQCTRK